jgi:hypothetical protein
VRSVRVVDHFTIERTRTPDTEPSSWFCSPCCSEELLLLAIKINNN